MLITTYIKVGKTYTKKKKYISTTQKHDNKITIIQNTTITIHKQEITINPGGVNM